VKFINFLLATTPFLLHCLPVLTDADSDTIKITVTGTRTERNVDDIPGSITVLDLKDNRQSGTFELKELIKYEPGISVYDPREINYRSGNGTRGSTSSGNVNIRGLSKNRVLMQRDGIRLPAGFYALGYDYSNGNSLNYCSLSTVDVLKGPSSAIYGSDALGGVVSFNSMKAEEILKDNESFTLENTFNFDGSNQGVASSLRLAGKSEKTGLSLLTNLCTNQSKEVKPNGAVDKYVNKADIRSDSININIGKTIDGENKVSFLIDKFKKDKNVKRAEGNLFSDYISQRSVVKTDKDRYVFLWKYKSTDEKPFLKTAIAKAYYQNLHTTDLWFEVENFMSTFKNVNSDYNLYDRMYGFEFQFGTPINNHFLTYGIDYSSTNNEYIQNKIQTLYGFTSNVYNNDEYPIKRSPDSETNRFGLYLQDEVTYENLDLIIGLRLDNYALNPYPDSTYDKYCKGETEKCSVVDLNLPNLSPKIGVTRYLDENLEIWGQFSRGFRAPTWWELQATHRNCTAPTPYQSLPNSNLKPESSNSYEIGLRGDYRRYNFELIGFYNTYSDYIENKEDLTTTMICPEKNGELKILDNLDDKTLERITNPDDYEVITTFGDNVGKSRIWGVEFFNKFKFTPDKNGFSLKANVGYAFGQDTINNEPLNGIDPLKIVSGIEFVSSDNKFVTELISTYGGEMRRKKDYSGFRPKPFITFDLLSSYKYSDSLDLSCGIYNLFNETYYYSNNISSGQSITGIEQFAEPGRHFRVGFKLIF